MNIILILSTTKKATELSFCFRFKIYVLIISMFAFAFKIIRPIIFSAVKKVTFQLSRNFSTIIEFFHSKGIFPQARTFSQSRNISTIEEIFPSQEISSQSRKFYTVKEFFYNQGNFL